MPQPLPPEKRAGDRKHPPLIYVAKACFHALRITKFVPPNQGS